MFCLHERVLKSKKGGPGRWPRRIFDAFKKNPKLRLESNGKVEKGFLQWACCNNEATRRISLLGRKATQSSGKGGMPRLLVTRSGEVSRACLLVGRGEMQA